MKFFITIFTICLSLSLWGQGVNTTLVGTLDYTSGGNDIWGFVDAAGTEYAIMGLRNGTAVISLADPSNPTEVEFIPGGETVWRDMKHWGDYVYVTAEAADGILVIDMSEAHLGNISHSFYTPEINSGTAVGELLTIHNLYIDEGHIYISGANINEGGLLIFDAIADPIEPPLVGVAEDLYSHDVYVRNDTMWSSNVFSGNFSAIDISDKSNPITLAYQPTSSLVSHNAWLSDNGQFLFTTDETANANVDAYDVSDVNNIRRIDTYHPLDTEGTGVVPHNVHVLNDYLVISYYTDGMKIVDASRAHNMIEVGGYDTYPGVGSGTNGCWGAYPFLPSGKILASDIESGLFVFDVDFIRGCYLEGKVTNADTGDPIVNASVEFVTRPENDNTNAMGDYATGIGEAGTYEVEYSAPGYNSKIISVELDNGVLNIQNVELDPIASVIVTGQVVNAFSGNPAAYAKVRFDGDGVSFETQADIMGNFTLTSVFTGGYDIYAGSWALSTEVVEYSVVDGANNVVIELQEGYIDPFAVDLGWTISGDAERGAWELGDPVGTTFGGGSVINPEDDVPDDVGTWAYVTGNGGGDVGADDVDGGQTILSSPNFSLALGTDPYISYYLWFINGGGSGEPNDQIEVVLENGLETATIQVLSESEMSWKFNEIRVSDYMTPTANMTIHFIASDYNGSGHIVEGGVDLFRVTDGSTSTSTFSPNVENLSLFPNPVEDILSVQDWKADATVLKILDMEGRVLRSQNIQGMSRADVSVQDLPSGVYIVRLDGGSKVAVGKFTKL